MKLHSNLEQGSDAWHQLRDTHFTASDAAAMLGESKLKSRNQLLHEKKTGQKKEVSKFVQENVFDKGHQVEAQVREILEMEMLEDFPPQVCSIEFEGLNLLASLDGILADMSLVFECKQWNATLPQNVRNRVLAPEHYWQLEHQLLVTGAAQVLFVVSDGSPEKWEEMKYVSDPTRRTKLIAGWKQFAKDLEAYAPEAKQELVVGADAEDFPLITYECQGTAIVSNIELILPAVQERAALEMNRTLDTDQDFADKEKLNKATKMARERLKDVVARAKGEFVSFSEFSEVAAKIDAVLQKMQSHGEKQVKQAKEAKKQAICMTAANNLLNYVDECKGKIAPLSLTAIVGDLSPDWAGAMKGKRTLESLQNAVDGALAKVKIEIDQAMSRIVPNQIFLKEHATDYSFLFNDVAQIINQEIEPFQAIVKSRIADHKQAEETRLEAERVQIREEEAAKAKREVERQAEEERIKIEREKIAAARKELKEKQEAHQKEQKPPVVEEKVKEASPAKVTPIKKAVEPLTFADDMANWAVKHKITLDATTELSEILKFHGMLAAS